ncbi:MAG: hypothetical protein KDA89_16745 [Planctomycetaceae bacterium]|nr:hypothetical protein [Planctomycetaceae bacterium]
MKRFLLAISLCILTTAGCGPGTVQQSNPEVDIPEGGDPAMGAEIDDGSGTDDKPPGVQ